MSPFDGAWLAASLAILAPLLLATIGEVVSEKSGILNVGLEGFMLTGAFFGLWAAAASEGNVLLGLGVSVIAGAAIASLMAFISLSLRANQVVAGVGINLLALGLTSFLFQEQSSSLAIRPSPRASIPLLREIPLVGSALFEQHLTTYLAFALVACVWWVVYRTRLGILIRSCGDYPSAADTAGHSVNTVRFWCVLFCGAMAGLAGAQLSVINVGAFQENMVNGRGFLALAAVVLGRWHPVGALLAASLFAATDSLQLRLQAQGVIPLSIWLLLAVAAVCMAWRGRRQGRAALRTTGWALLVAGIAGALSTPEIEMPFQALRALPFIVTMFVLGTVGSSDAEPAQLTRPYARGE